MFHKHREVPETLLSILSIHGLLKILKNDLLKLKIQSGYSNVRNLFLKQTTDACDEIPMKMSFAKKHNFERFPEAEQKQRHASMYCDWCHLHLVPPPPGSEARSAEELRHGSPPQPWSKCGY